MSVYVCRRCEYSEDTLWEGKCPNCHGFYRAIKKGVDSNAQKKLASSADAHLVQVERIKTGLQGFDDVLGGGVVPGYAVLLAGYKGSGKSTLAARAGDAMSAHRKTLYVSSEEADEGVLKICKRAQAKHDMKILGSQQSIFDTLEIVRRERSFFTIYDSLQEFSEAEIEVAKAIAEDCKKRKSAALIINQMTKGGDLQGSEKIGHAVHAVLVLAVPKDYDEEMPLPEKNEEIFRLFVEKNRDGSKTVKSYWKMDENGCLQNLAPRSKLIEFPARGKYGKHREDEENAD